MTARAVYIAASLAALLLASPVWSAEVTQVRVGQHPTFTRIVFELDAPAGYRVSRAANARGGTDIVVTLDASAQRRSIRSGSSLVAGVSLDAGTGRSIARIHLRDPNLPLKEMILQDPARIVLDVVGEDAALARAQAARRARAKAARAPKPEAAVTTPAPKPKPEAVAATPRPAPRPAPKAEAPTQAVPQRMAAPKTTPAPEPVPSKAPEPAPAPKVAKVEPPAPKPLPEEAPKAEPEAETPKRDRDAEEAARAAMEKRIAAVREAQEQRMREAAEARQAEPAEPEERPVPESQPESRQAARPAPPAPAESADSGFAWPVDPMLAAAVAGGIVLILLLVILMRRRRSLPKRLDVTALAEEEGADEGRIPAGGFSMDLDDSETPVGTAVTGGDVVVGVMDRNQPPLAAPGLFEEAEKGDTAMDQQGLDLGMDTQAATQPAMRGGRDVNAMLAEFERRIAQLESRLDESNEARERLERQVAAQSEELRVQRAAIARTQRALRGMSRSDEEQATEPALRDPS